MLLKEVSLAGIVRDIVQSNNLAIVIATDIPSLMHWAKTVLQGVALADAASLAC